MKKKKFFTKKKIIIFVIVGFIIISNVYNHFKPKDDNNKKIEVVEIEKRNIASSVSDTGVINTNTSKDFVSTLTGSKLLTVNVKEGDVVNVGDVICTFDTKDLQKNLNTAIKSTDIATAQATIGVNGAARSYNDAINGKNTQMSITQMDVDSAKKAFDESTDQLNALRTAEQNTINTINSLAANIPTLEIAYNNLNVELTKLKQSATSVPNASTNISSSTSTDTSNSTNTGGGQTTSENQETQAKITELTAKVAAAKNAYDTAKTSYDEAQKALAEIREQKAAMEQTSSKLLDVYNKAVKGLESTSQSTDSLIANSHDALLNSELTRESAKVTGQSQIDTIKSQLENGVLKSDVSGTITKVNFKPGDIYTGTAIAVLDGCNDFVIEAEISEYDIPDIKTGMKVMIKTDATRDEELEGVVTYISPVSSGMLAESNAIGAMGAASTSNTATYKIKIGLTKTNDRLRLGMNAKLSIITEMKENVWTVPYECLQKKDDGTFYIEVADNDEGTEKHELTVEKGIEGTYYTEIISNDLKEGMKVIVPEVEATNSLESLIEMMGPSAGM